MKLRRTKKCASFLGHPVYFTGSYFYLALVITGYSFAMLKVNTQDLL